MGYMGCMYMGGDADGTRKKIQLGVGGCIHSGNSGSAPFSCIHRGVDGCMYTPIYTSITSLLCSLGYPLPCG